jgi:hypothetical protein
MPDITEKHVKMCTEAKEIQKQWEAYPGDFAHLPWLKGSKMSGGDYTHSILTKDANDRKLKGQAIWIPRIDQLVKMLDVSVQTLLKDFYEWATGDARFMFSTIDQLFLGYIMFKKYKKEWNGKEWIRIGKN